MACTFRAAGQLCNIERGLQTVETHRPEKRIVASSSLVRQKNGVKRARRLYSRLLRKGAAFADQQCHRRPLQGRTTAVIAPEAPSGVARSSVGEGNEGPVVVVDNYDSFTYNLCQYLGDLGCEHVVYRNDEITVAELREMAPRGILISPGPGTPEDSGISLQTVKELGPTVPLFGVCMGLQCIGQAFGGRIVRAPHGVMHGKTSPVYHNQMDQESGLLVGLSNPFTAARYHSLVIEKETFPEDELEITAWTEDGLVMGVRHRKYPHIEGVQFHPESIITQNGKQIVNNFILKLAHHAVSQGG